MSGLTFFVQFTANSAAKCTKTADLSNFAASLRTLIR
jgi:hypothetical protein